MQIPTKDRVPTKKMVVIYRAHNTANGKSYIGFDSRWPRRKQEHLSNSRKPKRQRNVFHDALHRQGHLFEWSILYESGDPDFTLNIMEPYCIRYYNTHFQSGHGYNMTYGGEGTIGCYHSPEGIARTTTALSRKWIITDPHGTIHHITNLHQFCSQMNIRYSSMMKIANGVLSHYKGWTCRRENPSQRRKQSDSHRLTIGASNRGRIHSNESRQHMSQASRPKQTPDAISKGAVTRSREWIVTNPQGVSIRIRGLKQFCQQHNLIFSAMLNVSYGNRHQHKGWCCRAVSGSL